MKYLVFSFILAAFAINVAAQPITITGPEYLDEAHSLGSRIECFTPQNPTALLPLAGDSGTNQKWDFTGNTYLQSTWQPDDTISPRDAPLADDSNFSAATNVIAEPKYLGVSGDSVFFYYRWTSAGEWSVGLVEDSDGVLVNGDSANPPALVAPFPLNYGASWESNSFDKLHGKFESGRATVDGWGTLVIPGQSIPALRVKYLGVSRTGEDGIPDTTYLLYEFLTRRMVRAWLLITPLITVAGYQVPLHSSVAVQVPSNDLSLSLSPNPAASTTTVLSYTLKHGGPVQIELMDELGQSVRMLGSGFEPAGEHSVPIDSKSLTPGTYFIRVQEGSESAMQKFLVE